MTPSGVPEVSVIIVNWKSADYVRSCLQSIFKFTRGVRLEIIVVDSASFDGCDAMLAREFPEVIFVQSNENLGFGGANNLGAQKSCGENLLLLNPDTELTEDSIAFLLARLRSLPKAGAVGCRLLNADGSLQTACVQSFPTVVNQLFDSEFLRRHFPRWSIWGTAPFYSSDPSEAEAISGACILIKRDVFERISGFSQIYFMYGEDLDLCFKIKQAGCRVYHVPGTKILHFGGGSTAKSPSNFSNVMMRESVYRFLRTNRGTVQSTLYRVAMAAASVVRMILLLPMMLVGRRPSVPSRRISLGKWLSIFRWSVGLEWRSAV